MPPRKRKSYAAGVASATGAVAAAATAVGASCSREETTVDKNSKTDSSGGASAPAIRVMIDDLDLTQQYAKSKEEILERLRPQMKKIIWGHNPSDFEDRQLQFVTENANAAVVLVFLPPIHLLPCGSVLQSGNFGREELCRTAATTLALAVQRYRKHPGMPVFMGCGFYQQIMVASGVSQEVLQTRANKVCGWMDADDKNVRSVYHAVCAAVTDSHASRICNLNDVYATARTTPIADRLLETFVFKEGGQAPPDPL